MRTIPLLIALGLGLALPAAGAPWQELEVSPHGMLRRSDPGLLSSPRGTMRLRALPLGGDLHTLTFDLAGRSQAGPVRIAAVRGDGFLPTDVGRVVAIEAGESNALPTRVAVLARDGRELDVWSVAPLTDPVISSEGTHLGYRSAGGLTVLDLRTLERTRHPDLAPFAVGPGGRVLGARGLQLVLREPGGAELVVAAPGPVRRVAFARSRALALTARALVSLDAAGGQRTLHSEGPGRELRDLWALPSGVFLGARELDGTSARGSLLRLTPRGVVLAASVTSKVPNRPLASPSLVQPPPDTIPWPLAPNGQHPIGNSYGEYQNYGGSPYMHPGIDVLGAGGQPVYAVAAGEVKAVLTTSAQYHWRVAIADDPGNATSAGYLYAHLDQPTIAVNVGDSVTAGQYLGDLVPWPVTGFTHVHFARIEDTGAVWSGNWLCTDNPHLDLENATETDVPFFLPAIANDTLAFCTDESSNYQSPTALTGRVDIIANVGDRLASSWVCAVQELRYSIYPAGSPGSPVVDDELAVCFDMALDTYQNGPIDPYLVALLYKDDAVCDTKGDYGSREFFHVLTNHTAPSEAWDTTALSDGDYVIEVTARDVAGNEATAAMTVTTANGNP